MPRFAANITLMLAELPVLDRIEAARRLGFTGVEMLFPYAYAEMAIRERLEGSGIELALFNLPPGDWDAGERGLAALPGRESEFRDALDEALSYAVALGCPRLHAMAGLDGQGARRETYIDNLAHAAAAAGPLGIDILIEPINTFDMPGYFLTRTGQALEIIAAVGAPNLGLQLDLYHRQRMEGAVGDAIAATRQHVRHYQIADATDRGEPRADGAIDFVAAFRDIDAGGYRGWIGCEYRPRTSTEAGLGWLRELGQSLQGAEATAPGGA